MAWADNAVDRTALGGTAASSKPFIPDLWRDEIIAARENNLVHAKLFQRINHVGKKGDNLHIPTISNVTANAKAESTQVTLTAVSETDTVIVLNKHYEVSHLYEDMAMVQTSYQLRNEYTKKAGYALAKQMDSDVSALSTSISTSSPDHWIQGDGTDYAKGSGSAVTLDKTGVLTAIKLLDIQDVPMERFFIINPTVRAQLLAIADFTYYDRTTMPTIKTGAWGQIFGVSVHISNNMSTDNSNDVCLLAHESAFACAVQMDVRVQAQYLQDYLAWLVTSDHIYGVKILRDEHGVCVVAG